MSTGTELSRFHTLVVIDTEFRGADQGERHQVVALVAHIYSARECGNQVTADAPVQTYRFFEDSLADLDRSPLPRGDDVLYVAFVAQAEWRSLFRLGWPLPEHCVDLFAEAKCLRNLALPAALERSLGYPGDGLIAACRAFGIATPDPNIKATTRELILRGGPWTNTERTRILDYCESDVDLTARLWGALGPRIRLDQALYRGWYTQAVAAIEDTGIPVDTAAWEALVANLARLRAQIINQFDQHGLVAPGGETINPEAFRVVVGSYGLDWPRTRTGLPVLKLRTLKARLAGTPELRPIVALAQGLTDLRGLRNLRVGSDGRARSLLWPFGTATGRNSPDGSFIFLLSRWCRSLIKPPPGSFLCYADWTAQEFAVIAYLSQDPLLCQCYEAPGDPYANLGIVMGLLPPGAGKEHPLRDVVKVVVLGLFYGRGARSIGGATRRPVRFIEHVVADFWGRCPKARRWLESYVDGLTLLGKTWTRFGWEIHHHRLTKSTSAANFPVQGNAAEMLRWACVLGVENGLSICAPVHDALLVEGKLTDEVEVVRTLSACMDRAAQIVLDGATVRSKCVVFRAPERFADRTGWSVWSWIVGLLPQGAGNSEYCLPPSRMV